MLDKADQQLADDYRRFRPADGPSAMADQAILSAAALHAAARQASLHKHTARRVRINWWTALAGAGFCTMLAIIVLPQIQSLQSDAALTPAASAAPALAASIPVPESVQSAAQGLTPPPAAAAR